MTPFEDEIAAFEAADRRAPPPANAVLFVGRSSIRLWATLARDFPGVPTIRRGFGGSVLADSVRFAPRIVLPYRPRQVLLYAGDNDLAAGKTPEIVLADFKAFVAQIYAALPETRVAFIAVKPSLQRWVIVDKVRAANRLIKVWTKTDPRLAFLDVFTPMLGPDGRPRPELFVSDGLHLSPQGYALWTRVIQPHLWR